MMHEYDYDFWGLIDRMTINQLKKWARMTFWTLMGVLLTLSVQPIRLYDYIRYRWDNREEARIERESKERFENLQKYGHI